jgi:hypothetical protein
VIGVTVVSKSKGKQVQLLGYYSPESVKRLKALSLATRVPQAAYLREALYDLLRKQAPPGPCTEHLLDYVPVVGGFNISCMLCGVTYGHAESPDPEFLEGFRRNRRPKSRAKSRR